ncbi:hypothetical protein [Streptomyces sp. NPDC002666]
MSARLVRWAVKTHPARYRAELGAELEDAALASAAGGGLRAMVAEAASLAVHGIRLRTGLGSERLPGQVLAAAAPAALVLSVAGQSADRVLQSNMFLRAMSWDQLDQAFGTLQGLVGTALAAPALVALLMGRVTAARVLASAAAVFAVAAAVTSASYWAGRTGMPGLPLLSMCGPLLVCALLWIAPLRLLPAPSPRTAWLTVAAGLLTFAALCEIPGANTWAVADVALLLAAAAAVRRTRRAAVCALVALLPLCPYALYRLGEDPSAFASRLEAGLVAAVVTAAVLTLAARWTSPRRAGATRDRDPVL